MTLLLWLSLGAAFAVSLSPDEVVRAALAQDPALARAEAEVTAAEGALRAATGLRYDPTLEARLGFGLTQHEVSLSQPFSFSGEGRAAAQAARAGLEAAEAERAQRRLEVAAAARLGMIEVIDAQAEVARAKEAVVLTQRIRAQVERRLASGDVGELEVHLARLEEAAAVGGLLTAQTRLLEAQASLAATTGLTDTLSLPTDPMLVVPTLSTAGESAALVAASARQDGAEAALRQAQAARLPPVELGVWAQAQNVAVSATPTGVEIAPWSWEQNAAWTVGPTLSATLPLWARNQGGVAEAEGAAQLAQSERVALESRLAAERAGAEVRREVIGQLTQTADPSEEARAALVAIEAALNAGAIGLAEATLLQARVLDAWGMAAEARANAAEMTVQLALVESWPSLLPADAQ
ncbi:MAG: TolC family protein [Deltaproteobacteria bacterium]|nr:TolC family protein [Deltaproteobacteria bacterium]